MLKGLADPAVKLSPATKRKAVIGGVPEQPVPELDAAFAVGNKKTVEPRKSRLGLSLVALFVVGAAVSLLTGRGLIFSGFRQLGIGLAAALVTFAIGSIIGVSTAG